MFQAGGLCNAKVSSLSQSAGLSRDVNPAQSLGCTSTRVLDTNENLIERVHGFHVLCRVGRLSNTRRAFAGSPEDYREGIAILVMKDRLFRPGRSLERMAMHVEGKYCMYDHCGVSSLN